MVGEVAQSADCFADHTEGDPVAVRPGDTFFANYGDLGSISVGFD